jgi:hypothetical protein
MRISRLEGPRSVDEGRGRRERSVVARVALGVVATGVLVLAFASSALGATSTKIVRYGPYTIPGGTMAEPGMVHNQLSFLVQRPCLDCYITSFTPDLVNAEGTSVNLGDGLMLHHAVLASQFRSDATCSGTLLGLAGERFFGSGNERTAIGFPPGYGYRVRWYDAWTLLVDLMNHTAEAQTVYVQVTYTYRPAWESVKPVLPVWLDIDQCGDSEYSIPAGYSDTHWDWKVNVPGKVVAAFGHLHGHGVSIIATKGVSDSGHNVGVICKSDAKLDPNDVHSVLKMGTCTGDPLARLGSGNLVRLHSIYNSTHPADDVMGIMFLYINPA